MIEKKRNVYWFLIDGLSPAFLNSCGNKNVEGNFFDELINKGFVFTNVASTAAGTHTAMHSVFSSMYPSINGVTGWDISVLRKFNKNIFTLTDFFKLNGYKTFRYGDAILERDVPKSGFDIWESSGFVIKDLLASTDLTDTERRVKFIDRVKKCQEDKFVYHHSLILHELNSRLGNIWESRKYIENIKTSAEVFKKLYYSYNISDDDIVILSSDHGVILDKDWINDGDINGERHYEQSVTTFFAIIGNSVKRGKCNTLISSIDEAPTIIDLVLNIKMPGQGISRKNVIDGEKIEDAIVFREKGTFCSKSYINPYSSDVFYINKDKEKYVYGTQDERCEWFINLEEGDYIINHKDDINKISYLKEKIFETFDLRNYNVDSVYKKNNFNLLKSNLSIKYSIIIDYKKAKSNVIDSLLDLAGAYYEIIVINSYEDKNCNHLLKYRKNGIKDIDVIDIKGDIILYLNEECDYSEYFLSDLNIEYDKLNDGSIICLETGFSCLKKDLYNKNILKKKYVNIREYDTLYKFNLIRFIKDKLFNKEKIIDFYLIDSFEISHFLPFYKRFKEEGYNVKFIAEPCKINISKEWFDFDVAIKLLNDMKLDYKKKARKNAIMAFTTQDSYLLKKYVKKTKKINLSYGFSFKNDYFIHSDRTTKGFDFRFVHSDIQKELLSKYMDVNKILKVGYPRYYDKEEQYIDKESILKILNINTDKPIILYLPTWDDDSSIPVFGDNINKLRNKYYVVTKPHHCTTMAKTPDNYIKLQEISDLVIDNLYDLNKIVEIADIIIADAKSGASLEAAYINPNKPIVLLINFKEKEELYNKNMWDYFNVVSDGNKLKKEVDLIYKDDKYKEKRKEILEKCLGIKNYNYMNDVMAFVKYNILNNNK